MRPPAMVSSHVSHSPRRGAAGAFSCPSGLVARESACPSRCRRSSVRRPPPVRVVRRAPPFGDAPYRAAPRMAYERVRPGPIANAAMPSCAFGLARRRPADPFPIAVRKPCGRQKQQCDPVVSSRTGASGRARARAAAAARRRRASGARRQWMRAPAVRASSAFHVIMLLDSCLTCLPPKGG